MNMQNDKMVDLIANKQVKKTTKEEYDCLTHKKTLTNVTNFQDGSKTQKSKVLQAVQEIEMCCKEKQKNVSFENNKQKIVNQTTLLIDNTIAKNNVKTLRAELERNTNNTKNNIRHYENLGKPTMFCDKIHNNNNIKNKNENLVQNKNILLSNTAHCLIRNKIEKVLTSIAIKNSAEQRVSNTKYIGDSTEQRVKNTENICNITEDTKHKINKSITENNDNKQKSNAKKHDDDRSIKDQIMTTNNKNYNHIKYDTKQNETINKHILELKQYIYDKQIYQKNENHALQAKPEDKNNKCTQKNDSKTESDTNTCNIEKIITDDNSCEIVNIQEKNEIQNNARNIEDNNKITAILAQNIQKYNEKHENSHIDKHEITNKGITVNKLSFEQQTSLNTYLNAKQNEKGKEISKKLQKRKNASNFLISAIKQVKYAIMPFASENEQKISNTEEICYKDEKENAKNIKQDANCPIITKRIQFTTYTIYEYE
ncbi:hypothetical protein BDAP_000069 [Binucleata daphniae]